ncbi:MAG: hypothetical protein FJZ80_01330 [Bacteroidetes bacterium]|nr:hypothetical protein [Bacteroidota bacterium]MBM3424275.1 hypothetical protein [Bacteroidota bacterium]
MKKMLLIFGLGLFLMASCKKDYTCTCTGFIDGEEFPGASSSVTINDTKSNAEEQCDDGDLPEDALTGVAVDCEIQ